MVYTSNLSERFDAAVKIIQNLPKDGPYKPSNNAKLRFYSLFKQATEGKCNQAQPSIFSIINRAKWDSWNKLGEMSREDAMREYIEELINIGKSMEFNEDAQKFTLAILEIVSSELEG